jgi:hypothetical protein
LNGDEIISTAIAVHTVSLTLSAAALYAVFGEKFVRPTFERADALCSRLRGELSAELILALKPFVPSDEPPKVARINAICGADGNPLEVASITNALSLDGEAFQQAVRGFLDGQCAGLERYWQAFNLRTAVKAHWNAIRTATGIWPICSSISIGLFWGLSKRIIPVPPESWLCVLAALPLLPLLFFFGRFPLLARAANALEKLEV